MSNILSPRFVVDKSKSWQKNSTQLKKSISENDNDDDDSKAGKKLPEPNEEVRLNFHRNFWRLCQCFCLVPLKSKSSVKFVFSSFPAAIVVCFQKANFSGFFSVGAFLKWFCSSLEISFLLTKKQNWIYFYSFVQPTAASHCFVWCHHLCDLLTWLYPVRRFKASLD